MSCFSWERIVIGDQTQWVVLKDSCQLGAPFVDEEPARAEAERLEKEFSLREVRLKAAEQSSQVVERTKPNGEFVATPTFFNKYYVIFNEGRNSLGIFERRPFDEEKVELSPGTQINFKFINGLVKSMDKEIDSGRGSGRSS